MTIDAGRSACDFGNLSNGTQALLSTGLRRARVKAAVLVCLVPVMWARSVYGQDRLPDGGFGEQRSVTLRGRVIVSNNVQPHDLYVELTDGNRQLEKVDLKPDGSFEFRSIPTGMYVVRVLNFRGGVLLTEFLAARDFSYVELRLPEQERARPASGSISLRSLKRLPRTVQKEFRRAEKAARAGKHQESIDHLQRALSACPDCMQVHNNLGARYMRLGEFDKAAAAFRRAVELDPASALVQNNLAIALIKLRDYDGAEAAANRALRLEPDSIVAQYALGLVALGRNQCTIEALRRLITASQVFARAYLSAAQLLVCRGDAQSAIGQLEKYLAEPDVEDRERVEGWLAALRAKAQ